MSNIIKKITFMAVLVFLSFKVIAQPKIDSLKNQLKNKPDKDKIEIYYQMSTLYADILPDSAIKYANLGISLSDANHISKLKNDLLSNIGRSYEKLNKHKIALKYLQQALEGFESENDKLKQININNQIGIIYGLTSCYDKSFSSFQKSLLLSTQLKDTIKICAALLNSGIIYQEMKDYKTAMSNFEKVLDLSTKRNDKQNIAHSLNCISNVYEKLEIYKMSLKYRSKALSIIKELNDKSGIAYITSGIGETYKKLKNTEMALKYFKDAYLISNNLNNKFLTASLLGWIGDIYIVKKDYNIAKEYLDKAENLSVEIEDKDALRDIYESFSKYYSSQNDYKKALDYYRQFKDVNDSIYTKESSDKIAELEVKFDIQEKENENEILLQKTEIQQLAIHKQIYLRNTFIYISIIITLLVIFIFYRYWLKHRANRTLTQKNEFINIQKNELQEAYNTKDRLFSIITHDLKNPFGSLVSLCGFLEENYYTLNDDHKFSAVQSLKRSIINVNELLINLTDWLNSKIDNLKLEKTDFNLNVIIESVLNIYSSQAEQKSIDLQMHLHKKFYVFGDERIIKTVLRNLIDNALKFTPVQGKIDINATEDKDKIIVAVKDTGVGIDEADKDKLFNLGATFTTEGTHYEKGGGLGLILSKEFIEKNEGKIWFVSEIGKGSTFYFTLIKGGFYEKD